SVRLLVLAFMPESTSALTMREFSINGLRSFEGMRPWIAFTAGTIALGLGRFAPLGFLTALAFPRRRRWAPRTLYVGVPAAVIASALAAILLYGTHRTPVTGGELIFAVAFCALGAW